MVPSVKVTLSLVCIARLKCDFSARLWFQSCLDQVCSSSKSSVIIIDVSDSSKSWIHEAISSCRLLSLISTGRLNFIQFNDGIKTWQDQCYSMNNHARDDLSLWLQERLFGIIILKEESWIPNPVRELSKVY